VTMPKALARRAACAAFPAHQLSATGLAQAQACASPLRMVVAQSNETLQAVLRKTITRILKLLARRGALVEEQGSTCMADNDANSDDARMSWARPPKRVFGCDMTCARAGLR